LRLSRLAPLHWERRPRRHGAPLIEINESVSFDSSFTAGADAAGELD
jgi:hypothetical protein